MAPIDVVILILAIGALAAILWRAVVKSRRSKSAPSFGCEGCSGCAAAKGGGCAGCSYAQQPAPKGGSCCH